MSEDVIVKTAKSPSATIIYTVIVSAIVFGALGYWLGGKNNTATTTTKTATATVTAAASVTATSTATDVTAGWKTYTNDTYGVNFKYPSDWILKEDTSNSCQSFASITSPATKAEFDRLSAESKGDLPISAQDISFSYCKTIQEADGNNPKKWTSFLDMINDAGYYHGREEITFAGQSAYSVIEGGLLDYYTILMERDGHIYRIGFGNKESKEKVSTIENQILSTFQFTK